MTDILITARTELATAVLQQAIDDCHAAGGGRVVIDDGAHLKTGTLVLRSHVALHIGHGAVLQASDKQADYQMAAIAGEYGGNQGGFLIQADDAEDIAITGPGRIDGQSLAFMDGWWTADGPYIRQPQEWRPRGIGLFGCRRVRITDVHIADAAQWTVHLTGCEDVLVHGITITNRLDVPNCDGIDPDHCRDVRIIGCHIQAGDDGIVLKNTKAYEHYGACENILISDCHVVSTSAGIKIGTESRGDFRNVLVRGCTVQRSHRGLAIQLRDDGCIENVCFSDCIVDTRIFHQRWWGRGEPIYVTAVPRHDGDQPGTIRNVRFRNILCRGENGIFIAGSPERPIEDLRLEAVQMAIAHESKWAGGQHDRRPMHSQEHGGLSDHPTAGCFAEHVRGLQLHDVQVSWQGEARSWWGPGLELLDVSELQQSRSAFPAGKPGVEDVITRAVTGQTG